MRDTQIIIPCPECGAMPREDGVIFHTVGCKATSSASIPSGLSGVFKTPKVEKMPVKDLLAFQFTVCDDGVSVMDGEKVEAVLDVPGYMAFPLVELLRYMQRKINTINEYKTLAAELEKELGDLLS